METLGKVTLAALFLIIGTFLSGFVLMKLYGWFAVPIYNLQPITWAQAYGLNLIVAFLLLGVTTNMKHDEDKEKSAMTRLVIKFFTAMISYGLFLVIGYIVHTFI